jgi:hypothetical protein
MTNHRREVAGSYIHGYHCLGEWVQQSRKDLDLQAAHFTSAVAHELRFTLLGYGDPGDRFLVATAKVYDLTLVTADSVYCKFPDYQFWLIADLRRSIFNLCETNYFPVSFFCKSSSAASTSALCFSGFTSSHTFCTTPLGSMRKV